MIKGVLIDVKNKKVEVVEIEPTLQNYYKLLDCNLIDITQRKIGENWFDIICDDEGLLKENRIPSAINGKGEIQLVGNLLLMNHDGQGNEISLMDSEINDVLHNQIAYYFVDDVLTPILKNVEYE